VKLNQGIKLLVAGATVVSSALLIRYAPFSGESASAASLAQVKTQNVFASPITTPRPTVKYGFVFDNYEVTEGEIQKNEFLGDLLQRHQVEYTQIDKLARKSMDVFDVRKMRVGKSYTILAEGKGKPARYMIYEPSVFEYIIYDLSGETDAKVVKRPVVLATKENAGIVTASLWNAIVDNGMSYEIAAKMETALAWQVDFHHIRKGDRFKLIYEEQYIDGKAVGVGEIKAAYFRNGDKEFNAYYFEDEKHNGYFDDEGRPMKKGFLQSPVQYARISSAFNLKRFHPILRRVKAHLGTDYAAPYGTPIIAVADGTVTQAGYGSGNGNFVKLKHDKNYETQYLHMQKFANGIRKGTKVRQGEVIGYVGATGLATGPHVCFRFWKNGQQVDHRRENLPPPAAMTGASLEAFKLVQKEMSERLAKIEYSEEADGVKSKAEKTIVDP
jgi:murein DD-endopeptidase MepM/ murein hydrolase activator NlpD